MQIDPLTSLVISGPTTIQTNGAGAENDVDGLAWDPSTDTFYAPVNGNSVDNDLITIDPDTGAVTVVGSMGIQDVEGFGFTDAGELFGSTGNDGPNANEFLFIDKKKNKNTEIKALINGDYVC